MLALPDPVIAAYFDGRTAKQHEVLLTALPGGDAFVMEHETGPAPREIALQRLRRARDQPAPQREVIYQLHDTGADELQRDLVRLIVPNGAFGDWIAAHAPALDLRDTPKGAYFRAAKLSVLAVGAVLALIFVIIPNLAGMIANTISRDRELAIGQGVVGQIEYLFAGFDGRDLDCTGKAGRAALDQLQARLTATGLITYPITIRVFDDPMVNAFAAPGGQIVLMRGLLDEALGPDEVAGVLAHELGHVEGRDPLREAIRAAGTAGIISLAIGDVSGGAFAAAMVEQTVSSAYTRAAETRADQFGLTLLRQAGIDAKGIEDFFDRLADTETDLPEIFSSHPETSGRAEKAAGVAGTYPATPSLSQTEWLALKNICNPAGA